MLSKLIKLSGRGSSSLSFKPWVPSRPKVTWTQTAPSLTEHEPIGHHGTTTDRVNAMLTGGIDPKKTGWNFGASQGGPGLYLSTNPVFAKFFAANASKSSGTLGQMVSFYRKKEAGQKTTKMPEDVFYKAEKQRKVHAENTTTHEFDLGPTKLPDEIRGSSHGSTKLLTQHAIDDPHMEYLAHPEPAMTQEESEAFMGKLSAENAQKFGQWRNLGNKGRK